MTLEGLGARERQLMEVVYRLGQASVRDVLAELPDPPHYSTVRTMLNKLEEKGHLRHEEQGRRYVYFPTTAKSETQRNALKRLVRNLFDGSTARTMAALLDLDESLGEREIAELQVRIEELREGEER